MRQRKGTVRLLLTYLPTRFLIPVSPSFSISVPIPYYRSFRTFTSHRNSNTQYRTSYNYRLLCVRTWYTGVYAYRIERLAGFNPNTKYAYSFAHRIMGGTRVNAPTPRELSINGRTALEYARLNPYTTSNNRILSRRCLGVNDFVYYKREGESETQPTCTIGDVKTDWLNCKCGNLKTWT